MKLPIYQVDAFTNTLFPGNPAAVIPLEKWLDEKTMQNIALENNLSETAFFVKNEKGFDLRWFTPTCEVDLCGHATLATAHVLFSHLYYEGNEINFYSRSGPLSVKKEDDLYTLNFPIDKLNPISIPDGIKDSLSCTHEETYEGREDLLVIVDSQKTLLNLRPNFPIK